MPDRESAVPLKAWTVEPLSAEIRQALRRLSQADDVRHIAVMPDVHLAGDVCNGVAVATNDLIYPQAVGGDIGCGMLAAAFDGDAAPLSDARTANVVLTEFARRIPANRHGRDSLPTQLPDDLRGTTLSALRLDQLKDRDGRVQLGTLGRGNHFVELQADDDRRLWIMIHSGSRAMGQAISAHHLSRAERHGPGGLKALPANEDAGRDYLQDAAWAVRYAEENRLAMLRAAAAALADCLGYQLDEETMIHIHHNHVQRELHEEQTVWIHRKGAMPAADGLPGIIPGSMGTCSFHVSGRGCAEALCSSSHGAGRLMPRAVAQRRTNAQDFLRQMQGVWFDASRLNQLLDEAPEAYKDLRAVMRAQRDLTRITRNLRPVLVYK